MLAYVWLMSWTISRILRSNFCVGCFEVPIHMAAPGPPIKRLTVTELKGKKIGPHVLDYFKHVSTEALKHMGLALINRSDSAETLLLYSICVNSAAFKFINTVLAENSLEVVGDGLRTCAANFLNSVKVAMARIYLLSAPSLLFLQSLLCSVSCFYRSVGVKLTFQDLGLHRSRDWRFDALLGIYHSSMQDLRRPLSRVSN